MKGSSAENYYPAWLPVLTKIASAFVIALSCVVLLGWMFGIPQLIRVVPTMVSMNPLTALALIIAGISLLRLARSDREAIQPLSVRSVLTRRDRLGVVLASCVLVVGAVMLADYLFDIGLHLDRIFFAAEFRERGRFPPSELAPNTALNFFLCGLGLLLLDYETPRGFRPAQALVLTAGLIALLALIGYCYRILSWYQLGANMPMSLESALAFMALTLGFLAARPDCGFMTVLTSRTSGGTIARRLLPMAVLVPWTLGALLFAGQQRDFYPDEYTLSIFAVLNIFIFTALIWWHARGLYVADIESVRIARRLAVQHSATRALAETPPEEDVMPIILKGICETLEWRAGLIWERNEKAEILKTVQTWPGEKERSEVPSSGASPNQDSALIEFLKTSQNIVMARGEGLPGRVWEKKEPVWIQDFTTDESLPRVRLAKAAGVHTALGVPILIAGQVLGVMEFLSGRVESPDQELLEVLGAAGSQLGQFLERKRAQEQLRQASANLERSNTDLQQFVYVASHDLFEPLRMVISYLDLLSDHAKGKLDEESREFIGFAIDGAQRMQALINDLLAYSRLELRNQSFAVLSTEDALGAALANLKVAIQESKATITHEFLPKVRGDAVQLTQVFQNLIGNAIKFRGGVEPRIHVGAEQKDGEWCFSVHDNGIGIDQKHFERIFIIFQRLHARHEYPGTGMGLAICKKIVERHGGRISLESSPGKGSTFYFTLPVLKQE